MIEWADSMLEKHGCIERNLESGCAHLGVIRRNLHRARVIRRNLHPQKFSFIMCIRRNFHVHPQKLSCASAEIVMCIRRNLHVHPQKFARASAEICMCIRSRRNLHVHPQKFPW